MNQKNYATLQTNPEEAVCLAAPDLAHPNQSSQILNDCMAPWTKIRKADGNELEIKHIRIGDMLQGRNGTFLRVVNVWRGRERDGMLALTIGENIGRELVLTPDHPILVRGDDGKEYWRPAGSCKVGEYVWREDWQSGEWVKIDRIKKREEPMDVWNLELMDIKEQTDRGGKAMIAEGILVGDFAMQNSI